MEICYQYIDNFKIITNKSELLLSPENIGYNTINPKDIKGGVTVKESADIFMNVLENKATEHQHNVVAVNAAFALKNYYDKDFEECKFMADESIKSGKALGAFKKMIEISN